MKRQNLEVANTSGYRAPELYKLGTLDKVQSIGIGPYYDYWYWFVLYW